ncbi:MAG: DNA (cytosine-5-)-methyltransferase [Candidatus Marinimicrobia bacterium]|nr:DNA (cytosine-5-)-methyltransferase [Candidatus Neomarinimicrobiota bacterium]
MKFIELFAGIGGFRYGLESCRSLGQKQNEQRTELESLRPNGYKPQFNSSDGNGGRFYTNYCCVWANEIDKYACQIYRKNYGGEELYEGDITKLSTGIIPDHDLLCGGFPCQAFSIAGKRGGFDDTRGTLFFQIARIAKEKQPCFLLLENVKGLLSHNKGATFATILSTLDEIGYDLQWEVLNSKNFGVPQNRERVFIVGHLRGTSRPEIFPIGGTGEKSKNIVCPTIRATHYKSGDNQPLIIRGRPKMPYEHGKRKLKYSIYKDIVPNLTSTTHSGDQKNMLVKDMKIRRLTPTECERLQGFPDGWTEGVSDTQRYKCLGNAVTTNVIAAIGERIKNYAN